MRTAFLILLFSLISIISSAQPEYLDQLAERYHIENGFKTVVTIHINVPGIIAPPKTVSIFLENGKKPKIKGEGLVLLPKKGFIAQFSEILEIPVHWIFLEREGEYDYYKLVSLEPKSDWVTADVKLFASEPRIEEINITTRKAGEFYITHHYLQMNYPVKSEINFETDRLNIPLKFMGKSDFSSVKDSTGKVSGKIILEFEDMEVF
jgi:hypothetical protein